MYRRRSSKSFTKRRLVRVLTWTGCIFSDCLRTWSQVRSQDLEKGGAILKEWEVCKRPWLEFSLTLNQFQTICPKFEMKCLGKIGNWKFFPPKIRWSPKKKKKGLRQNSEWFFGRNPKFKRFFRPNLGDLQKKKKKVFAKIQDDFSSNFASSNVWGGALFVWGGLFSFFHRKSASKAQKNAILHTSQANGGARAPPPWLRYCVELTRQLRSRYMNYGISYGEFQLFLKLWLVTDLLK